MALVLDQRDADLGDERDAIRTLAQAGFLPIEITDNLDAAIETARSTRVRFRIRDAASAAVIIILLVLAWIATPGDGLVPEVGARRTATMSAATCAPAARIDADCPYRAIA
jgi:hypothetical protein